MRLAVFVSSLLTNLRKVAVPVVIAWGLAGTGNLAPGTEATLAKYHPGHYVAINEQQEMRDIKHFDEPALQGVSRRYYWADLEPRKNDYDFAAIRKDLTFVQEHHKQLIVFITDKTFQR